MSNFNIFFAQTKSPTFNNINKIFGRLYIYYVLAKVDRTPLTLT